MPEPHDPEQVGQATVLLSRWREGDASARDSLFPIVYQELRNAAERLLRREQTGHTLQPTALVHEAFLKLAGSTPPAAWNRAHFIGIAARAMRQILVDHARSRRTEKRGRGMVPVELTETGFEPGLSREELITLDDALNELARRNPRLAQVVEYRFFGGLTEEEIAELLEVTPRTVQRDWATARAWLYQELYRNP